MTARPHRHLCPEADLRDAMTDDEFWAHVFPSAEEEDWGEVTSLGLIPCPVCDSDGACGYDSFGRPLIHLPDQEDE